MKNLLGRNSFNWRNGTEIYQKDIRKHNLKNEPGIYLEERRNWQEESRKCFNLTNEPEIYSKKKEIIEIWEIKQKFSRKEERIVLILKIKQKFNRKLKEIILI